MSFVATCGFTGSHFQHNIFSIHECSLLKDSAVIKEKFLI